MGHYTYKPAWRAAKQELLNLIKKHNSSYSAQEHVDDVINTNKKNGRRVNHYEALLIAIRKLKRRYGKEIG